MKKIKLLIVLGFIICSTFIANAGIFGGAHHKVYFHKSDKMFDDYGPGNYTYPADEENLYEYSTFDITDFKVYDTKREVYFKITVKGKLNKIGIPVNDNGWNFQMIDIYIDTDNIKGSGHKYPLPGRNVVFSPDSYWEKMILITPMNKNKVINAIKEKTSQYRLKQMVDNKEILIPDFYFVSQSTIIAKVLKKDLGIPKDNWGYQVFMMGFNENADAPNELFNMEVRAVKGAANFGGGNNFYGNPNIIDMLEHYKGEQEKILSNYESYANAKYNKYAVVSMLRKNEKIKPIIKKNIVEAKENQKKVVLPDEQAKKNEEICRKNMKELLKIANRYWKDNPDDPNVTVYDLLLNGYIKKIPKCPSGGRYDIFGEDQKKLKIRCYNPNGVSHGVYEEE
jgi:hypothetical protein